MWSLVSARHLPVASGVLATPVAGKKAKAHMVLTNRGIALTRRMSRVLNLLATVTFTAPKRQLVSTSIHFELTR